MKTENWWDNTISYEHIVYDHLLEYHSFEDIPKQVIEFAAEIMETEYDELHDYLYHKYSEETNEKIEELWKELENVPTDKDDCLEVDWKDWGKGTHRDKIWSWFDEQHSRGLYWLMNEYGLK